MLDLLGNTQWWILIQKEELQVIVKDLMEAGLLNGDTMTCTGETFPNK